MEELGDFETAQDIYDEVLVNAREKEQAASAGMESLFAQVEYFSLQLMLRKKNTDGFIAEASNWLANHEKSKNLVGYQGIAFELAKLLITNSEALTGKTKQDALRDAARLLRDLSKIPGEFQTDAILLRRKLDGKERRGETPASSRGAKEIGEAKCTATQKDRRVYKATFPCVASFS